jgi:hypothetical protein
LRKAEMLMMDAVFVGAVNVAKVCCDDGALTNGEVLGERERVLGGCCNDIDRNAMTSEVGDVRLER